MEINQQISGEATAGPAPIGAAEASADHAAPSAPSVPSAQPQASSVQDGSLSAAAANQPHLVVKYNGAEHRLSPEEAVTYAQKGMNYDKIQKKLSAYENNSAMQKAFSLVSEASERLGVTPEEYLDGLERQREEDQLSALSRTGGLSLTQAKEVRKAWRENDRLSEENRFHREISELLEENPDLKTGDIPEDAVYYRSRYGIPLKEAYRLTAGYEKLLLQNEALKRQLDIREEGRRNSGVSTGSAKGSPASLSHTERVSKMSLDEYERYRDAIWAELKRRSGSR